VSGPSFRVEIVRSGGFAGITTRAEVDSSTLPESQAQEIAALLDRVRPETLPRSAPPRGADRFQYDVTIERDGRTYRSSLPEGAVPAEFKAFLDRLLAGAPPV
jgi:hypothetical protein